MRERGKVQSRGRKLHLRRRLDRIHLRNRGSPGSTANELQQPGAQDPTSKPEEGLGGRQQGQGQDREEVDEEAPQEPPPKQLDRDVIMR